MERTESIAVDSTALSNKFARILNSMNVIRYRHLLL